MASTITFSFGIEKNNGLWLCWEAKMDKGQIEAPGEKGEEASESALAIADAIYAGLTEIARAIDRVARELGDGDMEPREPDTYLDGTPRGE